jgi:two-component system sensor histidine kinase and response regulator WspE
MSGPDFSGFSLLDLFRTEAESQATAMTEGLLALERDPRDKQRLEALMRAAHSLKGAARIVGLNAAVNVAHVMEDCFVAAQKDELVLRRGDVDVLLAGVDLLSQIARTPEADISNWSADRAEVTDFIARLDAVTGAKAPPTDTPTLVPASPVPSPTPPPPTAPEPPPSTAADTDRILRVTADNLNRLLGLAGESLVEARWLEPFARSLLRLKRMQQELSKSLDAFQDTLTSTAIDENAQARLNETRARAAECGQFLAARLVELEMFDRRSANLSHRLYDEAISCRMRPFSDGAQGFPRMVRDVARSLGKDARFVLVGETTTVDRDVLEKLEAPLNHMLRNAIDHGIESPDQRIAAGKPAEGTITLDARHSAGMLQLTLRDDGRGIDVEAVRRAVVDRQLTTAETAAQMREAELFDFLFLPGFTLKKTVSEISGRGVGLDVVLDMMKRVRGTIRVSSEVGRGTTFQLQLPLTLSVLRALVVQIAGEPYGLPLAAIDRTLKLPRAKIETIEGRQHFEFEGTRVGLVTAHQLLGHGESPLTGDEVCVIVLGERSDRFGLVVDRFLGERELVVQPLDRRLGKVQDIAAGSLMEDGSPLLIIDVEDLVQSVGKLAASGRVSRVGATGTVEPERRKRVLVVDDSLTVRELERKLLEARGYEVEVAVDGMDGWNAVRRGEHDLVITDVDMPRMDGIELVTLIRKDARLKTRPVMIVSYKDREQDRTRGLEAGADYYLTKGSFHDESLVRAVADLIGTP